LALTPLFSSSEEGSCGQNVVWKMLVVPSIPTYVWNKIWRNYVLNLLLLCVGKLKVKFMKQQREEKE
jgi:hypothetical protein